MKRFVNFIAIIFYLLFTRITFAGCMACWELHRVKLELKDRHMYDVYIPWNEEWLIDEPQLTENQKQFPQVLLSDLKRILTITGYESHDLTSVEYPKKGLVVSRHEPLAIKIEDLIKVELEQGRYDGYSGAGCIPVISEKIIALLRTSPIAMDHYTDIGFDVFWLSYNNKVLKEDLHALCKEPLRHLIEYNKAFEDNLIIQLIIGFD